MNFPFDYNIDNYSEVQTDLFTQDNGVLVNTLGIKDRRTLNIAEADFSATRMAILFKKGFTIAYTADCYLSLHKELFRDIYPWAGSIRTIDTTKQGYFFVPYHLVYRDLSYCLNRLNKSISETKTKELHKTFARFLGEINMIHPFMEGNGRTQRVFITLVLKSIGLQAKWNIASDTMKQASTAVYDNDYEKMNSLMKKVITVSKPVTSIKPVTLKMR